MIESAQNHHREAKGRHRTEGPEGPAPQAPRGDKIASY
jgi:hypothetical protein